MDTCNDPAPATERDALVQEATELTSIFGAILRKTAPSTFAIVDEHALRDQRVEVDVDVIERAVGGEHVERLDR